VALPGGGKFADEAGERFWEDGRGGAQHDLDLVAVVMDVIDGEFDDAGDALGVEEQEQPGDPRALFTCHRGGPPYAGD
jgi:hypothetical protein